MKKIAVFGAGGFGREIASIVEYINKMKPTWDIVGFFDDGIAIGTRNKYGNVLGGLKELNAWGTPLNVVLAIASPNILQKLISSINNPMVSYPNIISPSCLFFDDASFNIGLGNVICHTNRISCNVELGNFNLLNGSCSLGHDVKIGDFNVLQPETRISGETSVGNGNFFGVRALVLQGLKIGSNTRIGTSSVVMRSTKDGMTYFGNPAKILAP